MIGEYLSALANSAALHHGRPRYIVWGMEDGTQRSSARPSSRGKAKKGNEELENWLMRSLHPQVNFQIHEWSATRASPSSS